MLKSLAVFLCLTSLAIAQEKLLNVSSAPSLKEVQEKSAESFESANQCKIQFHFDASGMQATLLSQGLPGNVFVCSQPKLMEELVAKGKIEKDSVREIAGDELVLITPASDKSITSFQDLSKDYVKKIAIGEPSTEPAGEFATQTFKSLKIDGDVTTKLQYGANVRKVLEYVEKGEVDAGVVYRTDAILSGDKIKVIAVADESWHDPILYKVGMVVSASEPEMSRKYVDYLASDTVKDLLCKAGFAVRKAATQPASVPATQATQP